MKFVINCLGFLIAAFCTVCIVSVGLAWTALLYAFIGLCRVAASLIRWARYVYDTRVVPLCS